MLSAPLVADATSGIGEVQKSVTGAGAGGPTRFSAADIPLEDQQIVARDEPTIIQRPAKRPRQPRAAPAAGQDAAAVEEVADAPAPPAEEESGGGLLARLLAGRKPSMV